MKTVIVFDDTERSFVGDSWRMGAKAYVRAGKAFAVLPLKDFSDIARGRVTLDGDYAVEFWCHGAPGMISWYRRPFRSGDVSRAAEKMRVNRIWFRSCSTFAGSIGHHFAANVAEHAGCTVAGHTHLIGPLQSGLHTLEPGQPPYWSMNEGQKGNRTGGKWSSPWAPNTITAWRNDIPSAW